ncbi:MAG: gliding motility-associated ABC transporter ATP-binding subunit GldA [Crocinitomicaceae bacterium]|jgi:ABC-2 type transport system ATP-binding protein|nr:gliding motility-associated ABC transporter ATP-binding subunit GldA [Cryomorphaceae bacterium]MCF8268862.1 gliding motility-associated ABC transporter ATP-binding subunit GldA [Crocinitomicaceae bacterium]
MSIEVSHLTKFFGEQAAVNDISFEIGKGEIVAFLGPNGAGKSTTMKMITGYIPASAGTIAVNGITVDVDDLETRKIIGYLPENNPLYLDMYVKEYLHFVGSIYKITGLKNRVNEMIHMVGLELEQHKKIGALSKGYKQRVGLAQAFIHDPQVLILDEPTSGLDPNQLVEIRELIKTIGKEKTIMLSTHIMQEVEAICDRVIIINKGKIVANNNQQALDSSPEVQTIYIEFEGNVDSHVLKKISGVTTVKSLDNGWLIEGSTDQDLRKNVSKKAQEAGWLIMTLKLEKKSLEAVFKELTKN